MPAPLLVIGYVLAVGIPIAAAPYLGLEPVRPAMRVSRWGSTPHDRSFSGAGD
ncbi:hypothetical protein ACIBF6_09605 [Streptosporangium amethystogenes]|uniref:hypothetical protein n=1 Tax=Streptosporangium amethystogenes TaxID=2002 RepID=UPI0037AC4E1A